jgi:predicted AAA+ superfamily ATPase
MNIQFTRRSGYIELDADDDITEAVRFFDDIAIHNTLVVIYGTRRIGKTTLINALSEKFKWARFTEQDSPIYHIDGENFNCEIRYKSNSKLK